MDNFIRKIILWVLVIAGILIAGYVGYSLYNYMVQDATQRIRQGVSEGIGDAVNPANMAKKMLG